MSDILSAKGYDVTQVANPPPGKVKPTVPVGIPLSGTSSTMVATMVTAVPGGLGLGLTATLTVTGLRCTVIDTLPMLP